MRRDRRSGFTLVELLVVIGIIALLLAVLLAVLGRAREQARAVQCASNIGHITHAVLMYASENKGVLPLAGGNPDFLSSNCYDAQTLGIRLEDYSRMNFTEGPFWPYVSSQVAARQALFSCPSDPDPRFARQYLLPVANPKWPRNFSYNFNA